MQGGVAWNVEVPEDVNKQLQAGKGYEIEFRPKTELYVSQVLRPTVPEPESFSSSVDGKWMRKHSESYQMPIRKNMANSVRPSIDKDAIGYTRIEVMSGDSDQILRVDNSTFEPDMNR